jgi:hypothetical protein
LRSSDRHPADGPLPVQAILAGEELIFGYTLECPPGGAAAAASLGGLALIVIGFAPIVPRRALRLARKDGPAS